MNISILNQKVSFKDLFTHTFRNGGIAKPFVKPKPLTEAQAKARWDKKKQHISDLACNIQKLKVNTTRNLNSEDEKEALTSLIIAIMLRTGERIGNPISASIGHHGVSGLLKSHVKIQGNTITLNYKGKKGVDQNKSFSDERIAKVLRTAIKNSPSKYVFVTSKGLSVGSAQVSRALEPYDVTPKAIRGYSANRWIVEKLRKYDTPKEEKDRKKLFNKVVKSVAEKVGHGAATLKKHYMLPELQEMYITKGKIINLEDVC